jgi:hypothetical protein
MQLFLWVDYFSIRSVNLLNLIVSSSFFLLSVTPEIWFFLFLLDSIAHSSIYTETNALEFDCFRVSAALQGSSERGNQHKNIFNRHFDSWLIDLY